MLTQPLSANTSNRSDIKSEIEALDARGVLFGCAVSISCSYYPINCGKVDGCISLTFLFDILHDFPMFDRKFLEKSPVR